MSLFAQGRSDSLRAKSSSWEERWREQQADADPDSCLMAGGTADLNTNQQEAVIQISVSTPSESGRLLPKNEQCVQKFKNVLFFCSPSFLCQDDEGRGGKGGRVLQWHIWL